MFQKWSWASVSAKIEKRQPFQALDSIPVKPGIHLFYPKVGFTKKKGFSRFNLVAYGQRKYRGKQEYEPWYLLTNLPDKNKCDRSLQTTLRYRSNV